MKSSLLIFTCILFLFSCKDPGIAKRKSIQPAINTRSSWNAAAPKPFASQVPVRITVHHEGTKLLATDDAIRKIKGIQTWGMGPDRKWADVPYHFFIAPDGKIYEGRDINTVGETNTEYNPAGHLLICCLGNYEEYEVPEAQLQSLISLIAWCSIKYKIPAETLATHRDYSKQTTCPGKNLYKYFESGVIKEGVRKILRIEN
jgi:N-acetylmuramoyl-L-alanine amidase